MAEIIVNINGNTSGFDTAIAHAEQQIRRLQAAAASIVINGNVSGNGGITNITNTFQTLNSTIDATIRNSQSLTQNLNLVSRAANPVAGYISGAAAATQNFYAQGMALRAVTAVWNGLKSSVSEALDEIKKADKALVEVRMVSGASTEEVAKIGSQAYDTAIKYGQSTSDYLKSVVSFTRAGYKEQAADLADLATKAMLVGNVSAELASQMLLSMDASYKFGGSAKELGLVLDGVNAIADNYATSVEQISRGLGKVAPIAAMVGVSEDELAAAIGTITAVTQRSGQEAATALRAIFLNIAGDTQTEIEDGATWTETEIKGMSELVQKYCKEAYDEAAKLGEVLNPMDVIGAFNEAIKDGTLTQAALFEQLSDIGGKTRTAQLMAIVNNWDMYTGMLEQYSNAAGSADEKAEIAMDSWDAKAQQLQTTWTKLVSSVTDVGVFKGGLDAFRGILEFLDGAPAKVIALTAAVTALVAVIRTISGIRAGTVTSAFSMFTNIFSGGMVGKILGVGTAIAGVVAAIQALSDVQGRIENKYQKAQESNSAYKEQLSIEQGITKELDTQKSRLAELTSLGSNRTEAEDAELTKLQAQTEELEAQLVIQREITRAAAAQAASDAMNALSAMGIKLGQDSANEFGYYDERQKAHTLSGYTYDINRMWNNYDNGNIYEAINIYKVANQQAQAMLSAGFTEDSIQAGQWISLAKESEKVINNEIPKIKDLRGKLVESYQGLEYDMMNNDQKLASQIVASIDYIMAEYANAIGQSVFAETAQGGTTSSTASGSGTSDGTDKLREFTKTLQDLGVAQASAELDAKRLSDAFKDLADDGKMSADAAYDLSDSFGTDLADSMYKVGDEVFITQEKMQELAQTVADEYKAIGKDVPDYIQNIIDSADDAINECDSLIDVMNRLKNTFDNIGKGVEKGDAFESLSEKFASSFKLFDEGKFGSNELREFLETTAPGIIEQYGGNVQKAAEAVFNNPMISMLLGDETDITEKVAALAESAEQLAGVEFTYLDDGSIQMNVTSIDAFAKSLGIGKEAAVAFLDAVDLYNANGSGFSDAATSELTSNAQTAQTAVNNLKESVSDPITVSVEADTDSAETNLENVITDAETIDGSNPSTTVTANTDSAVGALGEVKSALDDIKSKTVTVAVNYKTSGGGFADTSWLGGNSGYVAGKSGAGGGGYAVSMAKADGTKHSPAGLALVNEEGPELISMNGRAFIANGGKPGFVNLSEGAIVLTANETAQAMRGIAIGGGTNAYAIGGIVKPSASRNANTVSVIIENDKAAGGYPDFIGTVGGNGNGKGKGNSKGGGGSSGGSSGSGSGLSDEYWQIIKDHYDYLNKFQDAEIEKLQRKLTLLQEEMDDAVEPIDEAIKKLDKINDKISRQITLIERERDALTKPLEDQIEAMEKAKDIADDELELEERRQAVEEARAALQSANQERTIRFFNKEKGQWEWIADQKKIQDAQDKLKEAEESLADFEYRMQIKELENQVDAIETEYQGRIDALEAEATANDDKIYELNEQIDALNEKYEALMKPLEKEKQALEREQAGWQFDWDLLDLANTLYPEGNLSSALAKVPWDTERENTKKLLNEMKAATGVSWMKFDNGGVANGKGLLAKATDEAEIVIPPNIANAVLNPGFTPESNRLLAGLGVMFGASGNGYSGAFERLGSTSDDHSNTYIVNGLTLGESAGDMRVRDLFGSLAVYAN